MESGCAVFSSLQEAGTCMRVENCCASSVFELIPRMRILMVQLSVIGWYSA